MKDELSEDELDAVSGGSGGVGSICIVGKMKDYIVQNLVFQNKKPRVMNHGSRRVLKNMQEVRKRASFLRISRPG